MEPAPPWEGVEYTSSTRPQHRFPSEPLFAHLEPSWPTVQPVFAEEPLTAALKVGPGSLADPQGALHYKERIISLAGKAVFT